jgi:MYXO-CTERM domain-containing protein
MSERYAMYNVFLGLRFATKAVDPDCAIASLQATRAAAQAWNASHEDPDITADIALIDLYIKNLRANGGGYAETTLDTCGAEDPYGDDPPYGEDYDHHHAHCSAGGNPAGFAVVLFALAFAVRRRRSRALAA